jgi:hypothetical protein
MAEQIGDVLDPGVAGSATSVSPGTTSAAASSAQQGLADFFKEDYVAAAKHLDSACAAGTQPGTDWCELAERAKSNADNRYQDGLRTIPFSKEALLAPPALALRAPLDLVAMPQPPRFVRRLIAAGNKLVGLLLTPGFNLAVRFVGGKGREASWRKWPGRSHFLLRDLGLAAIRNYMNHNTLQDPYGGNLVGNQNPGQLRPEWTKRYRTATGAWNTDNPMEGAAGTRFIWQGNELSPRRDTVNDDPNPFDVARELLYFDGEGERPTVDFLNLLAVPWIQFVVHDWVNHRHTNGGEIQVPFPPNDPRIAKYGRTHMSFRRTQPSVLDGNPFAYENEVTAWWDGSQIYGSDQFTQDRLRARDHATWMRLLISDHNVRQQSGRRYDGYDARADLLPNGKLYVEDGQPPIDYETGVIDSGFTRNMWVGLELFHTLFVRHHNWLCDRYAEEHPAWSSDQIFNQARLENAAIMAKIHTLEWTPAVLPTEELAVGMSTNWHGMLETLRRRVENRKPLRLFKPVHPVLGGLLGGETNSFGVPQNVSEQFVEVYRLHAAMPDAIHVRPIASLDAAPRVPVERTRSAGSRKMIAGCGIETVINSFGHQHMHALVNNNYPRFMTEMSGEGAPLIDLAAADIVRARERGVPRFNEFRRQLAMPPIASFEELTGCRKTLGRLIGCYGEGKPGVEKLDLIVGMLCDTKERPLRGFDTTRFAIFLQAASRRLQTDPFFTEKYSERYYTKAGLERIDRFTLKTLLLLHFPALRDSRLMSVHNAFEPWGMAKDEDEQRRQHPLAFIERYRERLA